MVRISKMVMKKMLPAKKKVKMGKRVVKKTWMKMLKTEKNLFRVTLCVSSHQSFVSLDASIV